ncbi:alpha-L-arabinofuranosidase B domain protein [Cordyceps fumosorosea ARSEF 2679]|uniref:Alpha-L-arabinofuranosidase n=1 Tax=Cordyceps fumosorosea (strain ARSEF 2679) TaxID=1081104 RepID=A0A168ALJ4_CORFA|nr:alpha-L-arabinofuranosidase B domain protein [Cordyceps fumosorosea ARSEF 2679]OAA68913.1 alpha-L-arabinofuranosidase B domain protein [Cordyceps fumosorosea ARSEF 2679]
MPSRNRSSLYAFGLATAASTLANAGPCDIYARGGTPCVAAHSTTRALLDAYAGPLYSVRRSTDGRVQDIYPRSPGGVADGDAQDRFCAGAVCTVATVHDQSGHGNDAVRAVGGPDYMKGEDTGDADWEAGAMGAPVTLGKGQRAYGLFVPPGTGYRVAAGNGTARGDDPEGIYAVVDGTHYNDRCCFDYGNAETSLTDTGNGHMEALFFGNTGGPPGSGPWIMAEMENGLFLTQHVNERPPGLEMRHRFVTATLRGKPHHWAIRGGDATASSGSLRTIYEGARPPANKDGAYDPMSKEGAVVLGIGGDNSHTSQGTFYEGAMTAGYPPADVEDEVQADIARQRYTPAGRNSGPAVQVGARVSFRATTPCCTTRYVARDPGSDDVRIDFATDEGQRRRARWVVREGLGSADCYSFESDERPGSFVRHSGNGLVVNANDGSKLFAEDATFCIQAGVNGQGATIRSWSQAARYWRHYDTRVHISYPGGKYSFDSKKSFNDDASFVITAAV